MSTLLQDVKYALRGLIKRPGFTIVAVLSLALGVGANTAIFTVINAVFLHPLAIDEPQRVVESFTRDTQTVQAAGFALTPSSLQNYVDYRDRNSAFSGLAAYFQNGFQWTRSGETTGVRGMLTTANYFDVLGVKPALGRFFSPDEDLDHAVPVAVISHSVWLTQFGGDRAALGQSMTLNNLSFTIIGVAADGFKGTQSLAGPDCIWIPLGMRDQILTGQIKSLMTNRRFRWVNIIGRLKPAVSLAQADASMKTIAASLAQEFPDANRGRTIDLAPVSDAALGINNRQQFVSIGTVMMTVVGLVLLIACANLANLLLAQAAKRQREMSVRAALGASRVRLIRQLLVESSVLAIAGGLAGLAIAYWGRNALWAFRPPFLGNATIDLSFDTRVLLFTGGIAVLTGALFGLMPALRLSRTRLNETLKIGGRSGSLGAATQRVRSALVAAEIALATVALIGSGLFVRSMQAAETMDVGFDSAHLGFIRLAPGAQHYDQARGEQFYADAIAKVTQVPGVAGAAVASLVPLAGGNGVLLTVFAEGRAQDPTAHGSLITFNDITPGYFAAIRQTFKSGRDFSEFDRGDSTPVAIINDVTAKQLWPGEDALHKRFTIVQQTIPYEVVGVVATAAIGAVGEDPTPVIYRPIGQEYSAAGTLIVRTSNDPNALLPAVRDQIQTLDKNMPLRGLGTVQDQINQGLWAPRMGAVLLSVFGGLAFVLAMIGIYGVMSNSVTQRTPEIGVRMAFGAQPGDVLRLVLRQGMILAIAGAAAGVVVSLAAGRFVANLLFGIQPQDPITLATVTLSLLVVAAFACYLPARRATRVDPLVALRDE